MLRWWSPAAATGGADGTGRATNSISYLILLRVDTPDGLRLKLELRAPQDSAVIKTQPPVTDGCGDRRL